MCIDWPSWVQAGAAVAIVVLTGWTLKVLREYARDTKRIAKTGIEQIENSQMPFLAVARHEVGTTFGVHWMICNQGFGPALNVRYTGDTADKSHMLATEPLEAGEERDFNSVIRAAFQVWHEFNLEYESLSGAKYKTTVTIEDDQINEDDQTHTKFKKISD